MFNNQLAVRISGTGSYLPGEPVSNDELISRGVDSSNEWIKERSGISFRHLASSETTTSEIACAAARSALEAGQLNANDIDLIIVATSTPEMIFPSTACILQHKLGNVGATAFDIQAVCSGFVYALTTAEKFLKSGSHKRALVVGAELFSRIIDWQDRRTCVLFGDGAGAVVLEAYQPDSSTRDASSLAGNILASVLHADGSATAILQVNASVSGGKLLGDPFVRMDGQAVFKTAVRVLVEAANEVCALAKCPLSSVDWLIPHQANVRIISATAKKLGLNENQAIVTVEQHGNTSAASIPLALDWAIKNSQVVRGQRLLLEGVGGGFTWGAVLLDY